MRRSSIKARVRESGISAEEIEWELRPGGMLVQKRVAGSGDEGSMIKVKVSHGTYHHEVSVPGQATFGDLKRALVQETGLRPQEQRLLFQGRERDDNEHLHIMGVTDMSKLILLEDPASRERKLQELKRNGLFSKACEAITSVRVEVDKIAGKVNVLESTVYRGIKVEEKEFNILMELLMLQLLRLDSIEAAGELREQRRNEVCRVQSFLETLDSLKARNSNSFSRSSNTVVGTTHWETFESGFESSSAPSPKITKEWEMFE